MKRVRVALALLWPVAPGLVVAQVVLAATAALGPLATAWLTKALLDDLASVEANRAMTWGVILAIVGIATGMTPYLTLYCQRESERRVSFVLQDRLFRATDRFVGLGPFENPDMLNKLRLAQQHGGATPGLVVSSALVIGASVVTILGFAGSLASLALWLPVLVVLASLPILCAELWMGLRRSRVEWSLSGVERREIFYRELLSSSRAAMESRLFALGGYFRRLMNNERSLWNRRHAQLDRTELGVELGAGLLVGAVIAAVTIWAVRGVIEGALSVGDIVLLVASVAAVQTGISTAIRELSRSRQQLRLFDAFLDVSNSVPELPVAAEPVDVPPLTHAITFDNVWFRYTEDHPWVLRGVSFTVPVGTSAGLVGRNGSGKSTIVKLLLRLYDPTQGAILWDGVDIRLFDPASLRDRCSAVFQDFMEYDLSVAANIGVGEVDRTATPDRVRAAAERSGADGFIDTLPRGYDTMLSRIFFEDDSMAVEGVTLSGGQWQRLALARAFFRGDRDLMVLDEPSSGLDAEAEHTIHRGFANHPTAKVSLLISHRLGALRDADSLIVLEDGVVTGVGQHPELLRSHPAYRRMFEIQASGYAADVTS